MSAAAVAGPGIPRDLQGIGITEKLGARIPVGEIVLKDEEGRERPLKEFLRKDHPALLSIVYYGCPSLCGFVLNAMVDGLKPLEWSAGNEFDIITVSMDPRETPELAKAKKESILGLYGRKEAATGWHFLTGREDQIKKLADAVGFGYRYDEVQKEYAHGAGIFVVTPDGRLSRTLLGISYTPKDLRLSLLEAGEGKVGGFVDQVVLFCYRYDSSKRGYSFYAYRLVQAGSAGTMFLMGGYLLVYWRRQRRTDRPTDKGSAA